MRAFSKLLFPSVKDSTFFESCGVADLIASCCMYQFSSFDILSKYYVFFFYKYSPFFKFERRPAKSITENTTDSFKIEGTNMLEDQPKCIILGSSMFTLK